MTAVFVHGNPETDALWGPLVAALSTHGVQDVVLLSPPGFGAAVPEGWTATPAAYVGWLADELSAIEGPIDLVGHDWGAGHVFGLLAEHPTMIRSWAADCAGLLHQDYVWHDMAQIWQTPDLGEEAVAAAAGMSVEERATAYAGLGLPPEVASALAAGYNDDMGRCVLALYRAAAQPVLAELGQRVQAATRPPGMVINATDDPYVSSEMGCEVADQLGAERLDLNGNGHWWMTEDPETAAAGLAEYWNRL